MHDIKYKPKRGRVRRASPEMAAYVRQIAADNAGEHSRCIFCYEQSSCTGSNKQVFQYLHKSLALLALLKLI